MRFVETHLPGVYIVELEPHADERGFFARSFCADEFRRHGLEAVVAQCNVSFNRTQGLIRGLHLQEAPHAEARLVRCTQGAVFDVAVDLRRESATHCQWLGLELSAENRRMLYIPRVGLGFQTLTEASEVLYQMSAPYRPEAARGVRWDDPAFAVAWPLPAGQLSQRDRSFADYVK
jgi:dTDP-4-dehydrorhamnose 3,5-epimerase